MKLSEYNKRVIEIEDEAINKKKLLAIEYAIANNPVKVGDIFTDNIGSIKVEKTSVAIIHKVPSCIYTGIELKKDGTPIKSGKRREAYQVNAK